MKRRWLKWGNGNWQNRVDFDALIRITTSIAERDSDPSITLYFANGQPNITIYRAFYHDVWPQIEKYVAEDEAARLAEQANNFPVEDV